jgi:hypothetical protein
MEGDFKQTKEIFDMFLGAQACSEGESGDF